jgi:hypothetical protein
VVPAFIDCCVVVPLNSPKELSDSGSLSYLRVCVRARARVCVYIFSYFYFILCHKLTLQKSGFRGLGVACWPLVPEFAGSNPAEAFGFLRAKKSSARLPSEGKYSRRSHVVDLRHVKEP